MEDKADTSYCGGSSATGTDKELQRRIRRAYYNFKCSDSCTSLLKEVLNHDVFHAFKDKRTTQGSSFWDVIQSGATYMNEPIGIYAPDPEAYKVFGPLFNVAIKEIHLGFSRDDVQPRHTWGNLQAKIHNPDPTNLYIVSTRIRLCRNLVGYPFASRLTRSLMKEIEDKVVPAFEQMPYDLEGRYFPLEKLRDEIQKELREEHILFSKPNKYMRAANVGRFWPTGRGIFMNDARNFFVWIGKDDHLRIISMSKGHDLQNVYQRLARGTMVLEEFLNFAHDERLGYLTFDPANLGTTLRASYLIRLPRLTELDLVNQLADKFNLEVRGTYGARYPVKYGLYNISNKRRLGVTEFEAVMELQLGVSKLIWEEQMLEGRRNIETLERLSIETAQMFAEAALMTYSDIVRLEEYWRKPVTRKTEEKETAKKKKSTTVKASSESTRIINESASNMTASYSSSYSSSSSSSSISSITSGESREKSADRKSIRTPMGAQSETISEENESETTKSSSSTSSYCLLVKIKEEVIKKQEARKDTSEKLLACKDLL